MEGHKKIIRPYLEPAYVDFMSSSLNLSSFMARLLINRRLILPREASTFLKGTLEDLHHPYTMAGMEVATERVEKALNGDEKILVFGDFDVDGVAGTALITDFLRNLGGKVHPYIPQRMNEGYGLNMGAIEWAKKEGFSLLITVDCGISDVQEVRRAQELGLDCILTDHHEPPPEPPPAFAILNPHQLHCRYPFPYLSGAGVAFKLAQGLLYRLEGSLFHALLEEMLSFVALATVADLVPLQGENRILVREGLKALEQSQRPGIRALIEVSGVKGPLNAGHIAFRLGPRLNAAGRLAEAQLALTLLLTDDDREGKELAGTLHDLNARRQAMEQKVVDEGRALFLDMEGSHVLIGGSENWHPGVIGIAASRLMDEFYRPVLLVAWEEEEGRGSGRSIRGFNLFRSLQEVDHLLIQYGGHAMAAGFSLKKDCLHDFKRALNEVASASLTPELLQPRVSVESQAPLSELELGFLEGLESLEPHGLGNPRPLFYRPEVQLQKYRLIGQGRKHLSMKVVENTATRSGVAFQMGERLSDLEKVENHALLFRPQKNEWNGRCEVQLHIKDILPPSKQVEELEEKITLGCREDVLYVSGSLQRGWDRVLSHLQREIEEGKTGLYVSPTCRRAVALYRWIQCRDRSFPCTIWTGLTPQHYREKAREEFLAQKPGLHIVSPTMLLFLLEEPFPPGITLGWESPYPDFPYTAWYRLLQRGAERASALYGAELFPLPSVLSFAGEVQILDERRPRVQTWEGTFQDIYREYGDDEVLFYCASPVWIRKVLDYKPRARIVQGPVSLLCTEEKRRVFFCSQPLTGGELLLAFDMAPEHGVYSLGAKEREEERRYIPSLMDRQLLVQIYKKMWQEARGGEVDLFRVVRSENLPPAVAMYCMRIFMELGLIQESSAKYEGKVCLIKRETVDLFRSLVYNELITEKWVHRGWRDFTVSSLFV